MALHYVDKIIKNEDIPIDMEDSLDSDNNNTCSD